MLKKLLKHRKRLLIVLVKYITVFTLFVALITFFTDIEFGEFKWDLMTIAFLIYVVADLIGDGLTLLLVSITEKKR